ncbi:MAG: lactonase family protein [Planctomycetia bacterium]|nr:lactonase family protein [Planctomycetia bacterium]
MARLNPEVSRPLMTLGLLLLASWSGLAAEPEKVGEGRLRFVESVPRLELDGVVSATISPEGKFLYAASWKAGSVTAFARDPQSGKVEHKQTISNANLAGTTSLSLSPDARFAVAAAFQSQTVVLYERDPGTGGEERGGLPGLVAVPPDRAGGPGVQPVPGEGFTLVRRRGSLSPAHPGKALRPTQPTPRTPRPGRRPFEASVRHGHAGLTSIRHHAHWPASRR